MSSAVAKTLPAASSVDADLAREEREIAQKYHGRVPWEIVAWGLGNFLLWLLLWPLAFLGILPLWAGFLISTFCVAVCYLPSHEAQHSIIATRGSKLHWLNELVGHVSTIPLVLGYRMAWITHRQHHAHANHPELDPDYGNNAKTWWGAVWNGFRMRQPGRESSYKKVLRDSRDPMAARATVEAVVLNTAFYAVLTSLAWSGHAIEAALLWWLPRHLGTSYIQLFLSWAPHYPYKDQGRYRDTRAWRSPVGTIASMGMEYHIVHHLYPRIPLFQTGPAYWELRPILEKRGCRIDGL